MRVPEILIKIADGLVRGYTNNELRVRPCKERGTINFMDSGKPKPVDPNNYLTVVELGDFFRGDVPSVKKT